jgi:hypothetical protein
LQTEKSRFLHVDGNRQAGMQLSFLRKQVGCTEERGRVAEIDSYQMQVWINDKIIKLKNYPSNLIENKTVTM